MQFFQNKVVALTGAGSGMGRAMALQLAVAGARLALNDWNSQSLEETIEVIKQYEVDFIAEVFDVSQKEQFYSFADKVVQHFGQVDIIINNAGIALPQQSIAEINFDDFEKIVNINLWGMIYGTKAFLPYLKQQPTGAIANISSVFGIHGYPGQGPYVTTKFAIRGFTETLRMELTGTKITVTSIHPGGIKTNIVRNIEMENQTQKEEMALGFEELAPTSSDEAARVILNGIKKGKKRILIGKDAYFLDIIARLFPASYEKILMRIRKMEF